MIRSMLLGLSFICVTAISLNVEAKLYKWVDDKGITHYGEVIPPEYANKERDTLRKSGVLNKRPEKIDPAAIQAKEAADEKRNIEKQAEVEQKRRNDMLLNTYSNEKEIDLALDRSLVLVNARIESNKMLLKSTQGTLDELNKEAENRTKAKRKIPQSLTKDIEQTQTRVTRYETELAKSESELNQVKVKFENEKESYRKLKGITTKK